MSGERDGDFDCRVGDLSLTLMLFILSNTIVMGSFPDGSPKRFAAVDSEFMTADIFLAFTVMIVRLPPRPDGPPVVCGLLTFPVYFGESVPAIKLLFSIVSIGELLNVIFNGLF